MQRTNREVPGGDDWARRGGWAWVVACAAIGASAPAGQGLIETDVFRSGSEGYHTFRIPALVTAPGGSLLAFCEGRKTSREDLGDNDLVLKRSTDGGRTWGPLQLVYEEGGDARTTIGNPCPVVDEGTGTIWMVFSRDATDILAAKSTDDGRSWSPPRNISHQVRRPDWGFYTVGPGIGIQIRSGRHRGRLVVPAYHRQTPDKSGPSASHVFYSDDHGESWQIGGTVGLHTNECQVVETPAGLLLNARNHWARSGGKSELAGRRIIASSPDGGASWSEPRFDPALVEPTCQASLLRHSWPDQRPESLILFSNPAGPGRARLTVRLSYDEGKTWPAARLIHAGSSAYSCLARLPDGQVGLLYERDDYQRLVLATFPIGWLTEGSRP